MTDATIEHVLCGECPDEPEIYLCGTPRLDEGQEQIVEISTLTEPIEHEQTPCAVCFSGKTVTCVDCGQSIRTTPRVGVDPVERYFPIIIGGTLLFLAIIALGGLAFRGGAA